MTTFQQATEQWLAYRGQLTACGMLGEGTHRNTGKIARMWSDELGEFDIAAIRKSHIELVLGKLRKTRSPATLQGDLKILSQLFLYFVDEQMIEQKPRFPTISLPNVELELPSDADFIAALKAVPAHHRASLEFMMLTGLAPHECERLQLQDFSADRATVSIGMRDDFKVKTEARRRKVPLNGEARNLVAYCPFPTVAATEKALQRARGDMPTSAHCITPKMMRKWFSSKLANECAEHVLQRLLGHAPGSKVTRKHYVRSNASDAERAVSSLETPTEGT